MRYLIFFLVILSPLYGYACKCADSKFNNEADDADLIFSGMVVNIEKQGDNNFFYFVPDKVWKGNQTDTVKVQSNADAVACGSSFEKGQIYVVYARNNRTNACRRNALLKDSEDVQKLDKKFNK